MLDIVIINKMEKNLEKVCSSEDIIKDVSCRGEVKERYDKGLSAGYHCDGHYEHMKNEARKQSW